MNFDYNEEQQLLADSVRRYLADKYPFEQRQKIVRGAGWSGEAWTQLAQAIRKRYLSMRKTTIYAGSNEIQRNIIAKMTLGL